ncbi:MAG TPA: thioredoxin domain-containing protein [Alphaproteobacteria bacterium]|nr:thioredoxin domain-containing protein [Alphaproteobacteria bacterium]
MSENQLASETSPYLLQHKNNPVAWRPWGPAVLEEARRLDRPILFSIGYAACHWCHVMAHESFEDPATAAVMNELFVNVKVDREERPDLDSIYQQALALMGEQGGWPLTMFCTPDGEPFWGGTYFPPEPRYGRPGFKDLLRRVAEIYHKEKAAVRHNVDALKEALTRLSRSESGGGISLAMIDQAARQLVAQVDMAQGGIGPAPKFPQAPIFKLLWRAYKRTGQEVYRDAVLVTLIRMSQGGIYDHLGGGFARYSTDAEWLVPHFEKMLYDNAQLLELLTGAWLETGNPLFAARVKETVGWLLREMIAPGGGFAATQDADSEGHEGRFYVWDAAEIDRLLDGDAQLFKTAYDVRPGGNWEGRTILNRMCSNGLADPETEAKLAMARQVLWRQRETRIKPGWDDKVLADWNGLMITALARAALAFDEAPWLDAARAGFAFVRDRMFHDGRLYHSYRNGRPRHAGNLDDYANMIEAALALHEATGDVAYLTHAEDWAEVVHRHFRDDADGGYFFTADDVTDVIIRTKTAHDNATPSGNGVMAGALARLFYLTGNDKYRRRAEAALAAFSGQLQRNVFPFATLLNAAELLARAVQVVLVGRPGEAEYEALRRAVYGTSQPDRIVQLVVPEAVLPTQHPAHGKGLVNGRAAAYVCTGMTCSLPITTPAGLRLALSPRPSASYA